MYLLGILKKFLTNQKTLHIMKRLAVKSQNEGATSDAETLHNMKRLFIRVSSTCTAQGVLYLYLYKFFLIYAPPSNVVALAIEKSQ